MDYRTLLPNRGVLALTGEDRVGFLQGLVTNDVRLAAPARIIYACLLTPQGRFLHDMFIYAEADRLLLDCEADRRDDLCKRLKMFALRAKIGLADVTEDYGVEVGWPAGEGLVDPRHSELGTRNLLLSSSRDLIAGPSGAELGPVVKPRDDSMIDTYDRHRLSLGIPDGSRDMPPGEALPMENNLDALHGIAWDKGCYMGQELTARMNYRGLVKKRLRRVMIAGPLVAAGTILRVDGKEIGEMRTSNGDLGLALVRVDFVGETITVGGTTIYPTMSS
jgi:folate-binding protein YgfZ